MGTFAIIFIIVCLVAGMMSRSSGKVAIINNTTQKTQGSHKSYNDNVYLDLPVEIRSLIESKQYFELAQLLVLLESQNNYMLVERLIQGIKYKSPEISAKVDEIRQNLRYRNNLK
jgi:hypothetical protein